MKKFKKFNVKGIDPMIVALTVMEIEGISDLEKQKIEETDEPVVTTKSVKPRLNRKAAHAKRRKTSIFKDRRNRLNKVSNRERRKDWILENFNIAGGHTPFKHKKYTIIARSYTDE